MNVTNLRKLSEYLKTLPDTYNKFNMGYFYYDNEFQIGKKPKVGATSYPCGTVACAVGHGPLADMPIRKDEMWYDYSERVFGLQDDSTEWGWCFSGVWENVDNTPHGAALRIDWLLSGGSAPFEIDELRVDGENVPYLEWKEENNL